MQNEQFYTAFSFLCFFDLLFKTNKKKQESALSRSLHSRTAKYEEHCGKQTEKESKRETFVHDKHRRWWSETDVSASLKRIKNTKHVEICDTESTTCKTL